MQLRRRVMDSGGVDVGIHKRRTTHTSGAVFDGILLGDRAQQNWRRSFGRDAFNFGDAESLA